MPLIFSRSRSYPTRAQWRFPSGVGPSGSEFSFGRLDDKVRSASTRSRNFDILFCVPRSTSQGQGRHDRGRQSLRVNALDSPHMHVFTAMVEGTEAVEVPAGGVGPFVAAKVQAVTVLRVTAQNQKLEQVADWGSSCCVSPGSDKLGAEQKSRTNFAVDGAVIVSRVQSRAWEGRLTLHGDSRHVSPQPHPVPAPTSSCGNVRQRASLKGLHRSTGEASRASGLGLEHGQRQGQGVPPNDLLSSVTAGTIQGSTIGQSSRLTMSIFFFDDRSFLFC